MGGTILEVTTDVLLFGLRLLLLGVLYLFLLAVLGAIRGDVRRTAQAAGSGRVQAPGGESIGRLVVLAAGETSFQPGAAIALQPSTHLGRSSRNTVVLDDSFVSGEHAVITRRDGAWWLEDQGSTNGTYVNDAPVRDEVRLASSDVIRIGEIRLQVSA